MIVLNRPATLFTSDFQFPTVHIVYAIYNGISVRRMGKRFFVSNKFFGATISVQYAICTECSQILNCFEDRSLLFGVLIHVGQYCICGYPRASSIFCDVLRRAVRTDICFMLRRVVFRRAEFVCNVGILPEQVCNGLCIFLEVKVLLDNMACEIEGIYDLLFGLLIHVITPHFEGRYLCGGGMSEGKPRNVLLDHLGNALVGVIFQHEVTKDRL